MVFKICSEGDRVDRPLQESPASPLSAGWKVGHLRRMCWVKRHTPDRVYRLHCRHLRASGDDDWEQRRRRAFNRLGGLHT